MRSHRRSARWAAAWALGLLATLLPGCAVQQRVVSNTWDNLREVADEPRAQTPEATRPGARGPWSVEIQRYTGADRAHRANELVRRLREEAALADLTVQDDGQTATVLMGRFRGPEDPLAAAQLAAAKKADAAGLVPGGELDQPRLAPTAPGARAFADPLNAKQHAGKMTLQIGFYDTRFGDDFRLAAEQAARALRADGHRAFYYHGPNRSLITVGLFTEADFIQEGQAQAYGPRIRALQEAFPYNLANGVTLLESYEGQSIGAQPSTVVRIY